MRIQLIILSMALSLTACSKGSGGKNSEENAAPNNGPTMCGATGCAEGQYCLRPDGVCVPAPSIPASNPPAELAPTDPGLFKVGPQGRHLRPGDTVKLWAKFETRDREENDVVDVVWTSSDEAIVTVDSTTATAVGAGYVELRADAGSTGRAFLPVAVSAELREGPTAVDFGISSLVVIVGDSAELSLTATDAAGDSISADGLSLRWAGADGIVKLDGLTVTALTPGGGELLATRGEELLAGALPVAVLAERPAVGCDPDEFQLMSCGVAYYPHAFSKPGLSMTLEVWTQEVSGCGTNLRRSIRSPDNVAFSVAGVVDVDADGQMIAIEPGVVTVEAHVVEDDVSYLCRRHRVSVWPDFAGRWGFTCGNGDEGSVSIDSWPSMVSRFAGLPASSAGGRLPLVRNGGNGCAANDDSGESCEASASVGQGNVPLGLIHCAGEPPTDGVCGTAGCCVSGLTRCEPASDIITTALRYDGVSLNDANGCEYGRGNSSAMNCTVENVTPNNTNNSSNNTNSSEPCDQCAYDGTKCVGTSFPIPSRLCRLGETCTWDDDCEDYEFACRENCVGCIEIGGPAPGWGRCMQRLTEGESCMGDDCDHETHWCVDGDGCGVGPDEIGGCIKLPTVGERCRIIPEECGGNGGLFQCALNMGSKMYCWEDRNTPTGPQDTCCTLPDLVCE